MSSYIIAGSADSIDTAYCEQIANRIKAKYKNIDFRIVIKHPSEWEQYLQQICRIYGFLKKSNPIIYTFDGKIIGNKQAFMATTAKYFGLDEQSLNVDNLTNIVNMKIATQEINNKNIVKNQIKTISQKIQVQHQQLLKKNIFKQQLKQSKVYLTNGIEYIHREVKGIIPTISFMKNKQIKVQIQQIACSNIDLLALSLNDQIKVEQAIANPTLVSTGKQAFVTAQKNLSQHDKLSQASRTNKMHQSIVSYDKDSKQMKESSKEKLRIDQENDDCPDYLDIQVSHMAVTQLADGFSVGFLQESFVAAEMIFYHNQDQTTNVRRQYNDNRPVKGHRVLIKQVYFDGQLPNQQDQQTVFVDNQELQQKDKSNLPSKTEFQQSAPEAQKSQQEDSKQKIESNTNLQHLQKPKVEIQKSRTQPNLPQGGNTVSNGNILQEQDAFSQVSSDINLLSNLTHHTLFVMHPLSTLQLKNIIYFIQQTDCIGCLQFLPQNPNPKVKLYYRKYLLDQRNDINNLLLPVEKFIYKQIEDNQVEKLQVPNQRCFDFQEGQEQPKYQLLQINQLGYQHYLYQLPKQINEDTISKVLKNTIDSMFYLEEQLKKDIGYNLIFTKNFILVVPIAETYEVYNQTKLYLDGLAYLGFVQLAHLQKPYQLNQPKIPNMGLYIREILAKCANGKKLN